MRDAFRTRIARRLFGDVIAQEVTLAVKVVDDRWWQQIGGSRAGTTDRDWWEHAENLADALEAWRTNPLARQIINLTTSYVVGDGITVSSGKPGVDAWLRRFWYHRLNRLDLRLAGMCDELSRSGELFVVLSRNPADGMSYVRFVPASQIDRIETAEDDVERELRYHQVLAGEIGGRWWLSWDHPEAPAADQVMGHFAINRPVGATRGEGDLVPILPWLKRYKVWLEDRLKANKFKTRFYWDVAIEGQEADIAAARARYAHPPEDGSIIVHSTKETWNAVQPRIEAEDAEADGKAVRLMIAAGAGVPLHFLAEGESATRATAAEMGDPTFRHYQRRQLAFRAMLVELARRAVLVGRARPYGDDPLIRATAPDIVEQDNRMLAESARTIVEAFALMKAQGWIDDARAVRLAFKFAGEVLSEDEVRQIVEAAQ
ncbi:MAG: hypothetical protein C4309_11910 [Chloroflexota bacterium]